MRKTTGIINVLLAFALVFSLVLSASDVSSQIAAPQIKFTLLNQDPDPVEQGDVVEVRFKVENEGTQTLNDVSVQIIPEYPFKLYSGNDVQNIGVLRAAQSGADSVIVKYKLKVDKDAAEGDNEIKIQIKTEKSTWQKYDDNDFFIDIKDYNVPRLNVYLRDTTINSAGQRGQVTFEIANTDLADIKFLRLTFLPNDSYQILSPSNYVYLGDVDSDDTESEEFEIFVNSDTKGSIIMPIRLEYQDTNEKEYSEDYMVKLRIFSPAELNKLGFTQKNTLWVGMGVAAAAALGYLYWRRKKKTGR